MAWTAATTRTTGEVITASIWNTDITNNLNYLVNSSGLLAITSSGVGTHIIAAGGTGGNIFQVRNTTAGTGNYARIDIGNDTSASRFQFACLSTTFTPAAQNLADGGLINSQGAGGLSIVAEHASGDIRFYAGGTTEVGRIDSALWLINDTANTNMTAGLTINQAANDSQIFALKSSDVATALITAGTYATETDDFATWQKSDGAAGGLSVQVIAESSLANGVYQTFVYGNATLDTTKTTSGRGGIEFTYSGHDGANGLSNVVADSNLIVFRTRSGAAYTTRFIFDTEGSGHADVEWVAFDMTDDVRVLNAFDAIMVAKKSATNLAWTAALIEDRDFLVREQIVNFYDDGPRAMVNFTRLAMLHTGAIRQLGRRQYEDVSNLASRIDAIEKRLSA